MPFDTRYFWTLFTEKDQGSLRRLRKLFEASREPSVSSISIYEVYKLTLEKEGRIVAELRTAAINEEFTVIEVNSRKAEEGARNGHRLRVPMADTIKVATAKELSVSPVQPTTRTSPM